MLIQNNDVFTIGSFTGTYDKLPIGTYRLRQNLRTNEYYLIKVEDFIIPHKLYGDFKSVKRILNSFSITTKNLAALFVGIKGAGKSIEAKKLCIDSGLPVIIIDAGYDDVELISFLSSPELGSCVIFIDEYEKLYSNKNTDETTMLQILDGACNSHHLFILTVNSMNSFNSNLINRPSRIFYRKTYEGLTDDIINEVLDAELVNKNWKEEMLTVLGKFCDVTFDILMSLIREVNLYDESPLECAKLMNFSSESVYVDVIQMFEDGTKKQCSNTNFFEGSNSLLELCTYRDSTQESDYDWIYYKTDLIKRISPTTWELKDDEGHHFIFTKTSKIKFLF